MFLEALTTSSLILASGAPDSIAWCAPAKSTMVRVGLTSAQPTADLSKTMKQLEGFHIDTKNPYGPHAETHVGGLTDGMIKVEQQVGIGGVNYGDQVCLWYSSVDVTVRLTQKVYVAREYKPGTCMYNAVWDHEHKHVRVDREIINKYRPVYEQAVQQYIARAGVSGPMDAGLQQKTQANMVEGLRRVVSGVTDKMEAERSARQQAVDTRAEYDRVSALCRGKK